MTQVVEKKELKEEWVGIRGWYQYAVSNLGRIQNLNTGVLLQPKAYKGRTLQVRLYAGGVNKSFMLNRLVASHFLSGYDDNLEVRYHDENQKNCRADNLYQAEVKKRGQKRAA